MSNLKSHAPAPSDLVNDDADRASSGAGIVVIILGCLLALGLMAAVVVVGFAFHVTRTRQQAEERARMTALVEMGRAQAELAAQRAEAQARIAELQSSQAPGAIGPGAAPVAPLEQPPAPSPEELFAAEIAPLNQEVMDRPDDPEVWKARARVLQRWQKWREAAEDYDRYLELNPVNLWIRLEAAATRFACGDREAYLAHCKLAEERLVTKPEPTIEHNRAARVLCLGPGALTIGERLLVQAQDQPLKDPGKWWLLEPMAALQYRTGRYAEALQTLEQTCPIAWNNGQRAATEIWAAMAYHQLGQHEQAAQALAAAERHVASGVPAPGADSAGGDAVIIALFMMDEAKTLLAEQKSAEPKPLETNTKPAPESSP